MFLAAAQAAAAASSSSGIAQFVDSFFSNPLTIFTVGIALLILFWWYFATEFERTKRNVGTFLLFGICGLCIFSVIPPSERLKQGIDIAGGSSFTLKIQPKVDELGNAMPITVEQAEQAKKVIQNRLDSFGGKESFIAIQGNDTILVQMPGVKSEESKAIRTILEKVAKLELREVSKRTNEVGPDGKTLAQRVKDGTEIVPGYQAYTYKHKNDDGVEIETPILLNKRVALGGSDIVRANPSASRQDAVDITLNGPGTDKMIALSTPMTNRRGSIAIVLDGVVKSAPVVNSDQPLGKDFIVEGLNEPGEVQGLANALMNPLENALKVAEERSVSPTLGEAIVKQGIWAGVIGLAITAVFVLMYYRLAGVIALVGLAVNGIILFGVMAILGSTFSLPGIAGMILTIGMAVDANVLIYERLREEMDAGKSLKNAIEVAYDKAFTAIFDSNLTSLITAAILFIMASGAVKGFAVTLTIGIIASMFAAILVTRVLFRWGVDLNLLRNKLTFFNLIKATNYDFLGKAKICAIASVALVVLSLAAFGIRQEKAFGVDFTGGTLVQFELGKDVDIPLADVTKVIDGLKGQLASAAYAQKESNPATGSLLTIRCATDNPKANIRDTSLIISELRKAIPILGEHTKVMNEATKTEMEVYKIPESKEEVSALIGGAYLYESLIALVLGLVGILIYVTVRFEFSFALGGFIAILHDVIISLGIVVLLGGELSLIHVGAILTIAGYSINDTIVVFDRVRESLFYRSGSVKDLMNEAINATLSRTLLTSATTIITVAILSLFGGSNLRDFSIIILIGLVVGTYSSIFVASPVVLWWSSRKGGNLRDDVVTSSIEQEILALDK
ncbi:MAG: protein translocase subunit SecD [Verrucomicrobia bacterium]|nr:protein translocase subunit SecD [Verrucomicrobiota bacterium]